MKQASSSPTEIEKAHTSKHVVRVLVSALFSAFLLFLTFILFNSWAERADEEATGKAQVELEGLKSNLALLIDEQAMFTTVFGHRLQERVNQGVVPSLNGLSDYLQIIAGSQKAFAYSQLIRSEQVVDTYSRQTDVASIDWVQPHYQGMDVSIQASGNPIIEGPLFVSDSEAVLEHRFLLSDLDGQYWGTLTVCFSFSTLLKEAGFEEGLFSLQYQKSGSDPVQWWGDPALVERGAVETDLAYSMSNWQLYHLSNQGRSVQSIPLTLYGIIGPLFSVAMGFVLYGWMKRYHHLKVRSHTDSLTGFLNKSVFLLTLEQEIREGNPFALAIIDIDDFKQINDQYGHLVGDKALSAIADTLKHQVRMSDSIGRFGGDEFTLLFRGCKHTSSCKRIYDAISQVNCEYEGHSLSINLSMGASFFPIEGKTSTDLFRIADRRLYTAKQQGKGRFFAHDI